MCSDSNTMHALCVQIVFLYRLTIFFYTFILPEINITLCQVEMLETECYSQRKEQ
jgi:hypothetical protein